MRHKFLSLILVCLLGISSAFAQTVGIAPFGYGASATGGGSATPTLVSTLAQLKSALSSKPANKVIIITQSITLDGVIQVKDGKNLTILGLPGVKLYNPNWEASLADAAKITGIFEFTRIDNLIVRNIIFEGGGAYDCDGRDHITLENVTNAWIDHCDFQDAVDDCMDIKKLSDNITVSWCKFHYEKAYHPNGPGDASGDKDHRFVNLVGSASSDAPSDGRFNITWAYCWWGNGSQQRMVRFRNADLHFLGCYWNAPGASYYLGPEKATAYVELCTFDGISKNLWKSYGTPIAFKNANSVALKGTLPTDGTVSTPSYTSGLTKYASAAAAKADVTNETYGAGATLNVTTSGAVSSRSNTASLKTCKITFDANGGSGSMSQQSCLETIPTAINANTFTRSGYAFTGWKTAATSGTSYADEAQITLTGDITLYAQWAQAYTVSFNANGHGTAPASQTVVSGSKATEPANPSASGYSFKGWYTESGCTNKFDFNTAITANRTLYAKWEVKTCDEQVWYHSLPSGASQADCFTFAVAPTGGSACDATLTIDGTEYHAEKRSSDWNSTFTFTIPTGSTGVFHICAKSSSGSSTRTLTLTKNGTAVTTLGVLTLQTYSTESLEAGTYTVSTGGNIHIAMMGLQTCGTSQVSDNKTYYTVTFSANGHGTAPSSQSIVQNGVASEPVAPTASGYVFGGWYKESACTSAWNFSTDLVTKNTTLYAKWTQAAADKVTVIFDINGHGTAPASQSVEKGSAVSEPTEPTATNYDFGGWYDNAACTGNAWDFSDPVSANMTLYAKWTENLNSGWSLTGELEGTFLRNAGDQSSKAYATVHLNANTTYEFNIEKAGGNTYTYSTAITATKSSMGFVTGSTAASIRASISGNYEFTIDYTTATSPKVSVTYPASVTVTYNNNGHGTAPASQTIALNTTATRPADLTADGYIFGGWYKESACTNAWNFSDKVSASMTLYAKWSEASAVSDNCWSWTAADTLKTTTDFNGLSVVANSTNTVVIDASNKTIGDKLFSHRLKLGGTGNASYRHIILPVTGKCAISVYAISSSSTADRTLTLRSGSFSGTEIGTASAPGASGAKTVINYTGSAANIYIYSPSSGVNVYGICVDYSGAAAATYTVSYNLNGHGSAISDVTGTTTLPATLPTPSASGWTFGGWYTNSGLTIAAVAGATISANTTLYAKWTQVQTTGGYTISYNMNGYGTAISDVTNATALPNPLPTPTATGYTFGGWYTNSSLTAAATAGATISQNTMLYAKWTAVETPAQPSNSDLYGGWFESCWMEFGPATGASEYKGYVSANGGATWTMLDRELIRWYPNGYGRVDAVGLSAGNYMLKIVPVVSGMEDCSQATVSGILQVKAHDRTGFAHTGVYATTGVGAYKNDGTLKDNARVLYVTAATAATVQLSMKTSSSAETVLTGLQAILGAYEKAQETRPLAIRIIGTITAADMDGFNSSEEGLQVKGKGYTPLNLTIEGIGKDAAIKDFGILNRGVTSVEYRNFAILNCMDDCLGMDTKNSYMWIHNIDFYYGQAGSAADQVKGDGTVDLKGDSQHITISYNHFFDSGKMSLCGMKSETGPNYITYHHNHFDHSDSRHPRIRTMSVHIFNNYYDGNAKYGVGACMGSSAFVEGNYFRACSKPMMSSMQGTDALGEGTFSGENGGIIKAYNNYFATSVSYITYQTNSTSFDAYEVANRTDKVPSSVVTVQGATTYDNFDTEYANMYSVTLDNPQNVPSIVLGTYGAGRCQHGDLNFQFSTADDSDYKVNATLKSQVTNYSSSWDGTICGNTTATACSASSTGYNVVAQVSPAGYGEVNKTAILDVAKGKSISANGATLTVDGQSITATAAAQSAEYTYSFTGWTWTPSGSTISAATTATANFSRTARSYTLTWDANGGSSLSGTYTKGTVAYGTAIAQPADPTRSGYTFLGWSPSPAATMPAANTTYTAQWKDNSVQGYTVTFNMNGHGDAIATVTDVTAIPTLTTPTADGYTFGGWYTDSELSFVAVEGTAISANTTLYAKWTQNQAAATGDIVCDFAQGKPSSSLYTVTGNYNSTAYTYCSTDYAKGLKMESSTNVSFTLASAKTLYFVFSGTGTSKIDGSTVTPDANFVVTATLAAGTHTLTKANSNALYLITDHLCGESAPTVEPTLTKYQIRFMNGAEVLQSGEVEEGSTPAYNGATPTKAATATTEYTFTGWEPAIAAVSAAQDYQAQFSESAVKYTLTWDLAGGTIATAGTAAGSVANGTELVAPVVTREGYTFAGWSPAVASTMPAENTTYTATWTCNITGTIYSADNKAGVAGTLEDLHTKRATYPNAVMIVSSNLASSIAADEENVILDYAVGSNGGHYYECGKFVLVDPAKLGHTDYEKASFYTPVDFIAVTGSYSRNYKNNTQEFCLPFDVDPSQFSTAVKLLTFAYYEPIYEETSPGSGVYTPKNAQYVYFNEQNSISAGIPFHIYSDPAITSTRLMSATFSNTFIAKDVENSGNLKGTYVHTTEYMVAGYYCVSSTRTQLTDVTKLTNGKTFAFRSILTLANDSEFNGGSNHGGQTSAPERLIVRIVGENNETTDLGEIVIRDNEIPQLPTYSIDGKLVGEISGPGLYIVNGKVVFINK